MSRHNFSDNGYDVVVGSDKPLANVFMDIQKEDSHYEDYEYDSMLKNDNYFIEKNIMYYVKVANDEYGIIVPQKIIEAIQEEMRQILGDENEDYDNNILTYE